MTFIIPPNGTHSQTNINDTSGTIYQSKNINLDEDGYIKLSDAVFNAFSTADNADFNGSDTLGSSPTGFEINSDEAFSTSSMNIDKSFSSRKSETNRPAPGFERDYVYFNNAQVMGSGTEIKYKSGATSWTTVTVSLSSGGPTVMTKWGAANVLVVAKNNLVKFVNTSWVVDSTILTLPNDYNVSSMTSIGNTLYIATRSKNGGEAQLFTTTSIKTSPDNLFGCGTYEIFSIAPFQSSVVAVTPLGQLLRFTGGGFEELASLPVYQTSIEWGDAQNNNSTVSNRGLVVDGDLIYINLTSESSSLGLKILPNFPSGVWCYDMKLRSLYHKYSASLNDFKKVGGGVVTVNTTNNNFTLTSGNLDDVLTGSPLIYGSLSPTFINELVKNEKYFLIKDSSTVFRLARTEKDALAGTEIDINSVGDNFQSWYIWRIKDYGMILDSFRKSVLILNSLLFDSTKTGRIAFSSSFENLDTFTLDGVLCGTVPKMPNRGYFITPKISSLQIEDTWQALYVKHLPLKTDDKIVIKYKSTEREGLPVASLQGQAFAVNTGVWTNTTTFTTKLDMSLMEVGDEIEITQGLGAGHLAHITALSLSSGTWTVTLGEEFKYAVATKLFQFQVDNWSLLETVTVDSPSNGAGFVEVGLSDKDGNPLNSKFIQFKIEMRGVNLRIDQLLISNQGQKYTSLYN